MNLISKFDDYRDFLNHKVLIANESHFSYQHFANKIKSSKSYLKLVVEKKRHISLNKIIRISEYFKLSDFEKQYFIFLFLKCTVKDDEIKEFFDTILAQYSGSYSQDEVHRSDQLKQSSPEKTIEKNNNTIQQVANNNFIFRSWINLAIMGLARLPGYKHEADWIHEMLGGALIVKIEDVKYSMKILESNGSIYFSDDKALRNENPIIEGIKPFDLEDNNSFLSGLERTALFLKLKGKTSLHRPNRSHLYCLALSDEDIKKVLMLYDELSSKINLIDTASKNPKKLYWLSNHIFTLSKQDPGLQPVQISTKL